MKKLATLMTAATLAGSGFAGTAFAQQQFNFGDDDGYEVETTVEAISPDGMRYGLANGIMIRDGARYYTITDGLQVGDRVVLMYSDDNTLESVGSVM